MKRVLLTIAYDGTAYHGWQVQPNGVTFQQTLQDGLEKILGTRVGVTGCSRTDAGVHAREFCCHFDCDEKFPSNAFLKGLNSVLPDDIAVTDCRTVDSGFHARYSAHGKAYVYNMYTGTSDPFRTRYSLRLEKAPDGGKIAYFCNTVVGTHDFAGFSSSRRSVEDTVRTVTDCHFETDGSNYRFCISADGFLYNMVRIIAGTALEVSSGRLSPDCAADIFRSGDRFLAGQTLPPQGLFLHKVFY